MLTGTPLKGMSDAGAGGGRRRSGACAGEKASPIAGTDGVVRRTRQCWHGGDCDERADRGDGPGRATGVRPGRADRPCYPRAGGAAGRGSHGPDGSGRRTLRGPDCGGRPARGQQGVHQGRGGRGRHPDRAVGAVRRCGRSTCLYPQPRCADRDQGRRAGGRQGRRCGAYYGRGHRGGHAGAARRAGGGGGVPDRAGGQPVCAMQRDGRCAAGHCARSQAGGRR